MIHADEIQLVPSQSQVSLTIVETAQISPASRVSTAEQLDSRRPGELILSGSNVLNGFLCALCGVGLFLWVMTKLWLFEA